MVDGGEVHLAKREWGLLAYLARYVGTWCDSEDILRTVWGPEWVTGERLQKARRTERRDLKLVTITACRLRARLGLAGTLLETHPSMWKARRLASAVVVGRQELQSARAEEVERRIAQYYSPPTSDPADKSYGYGASVCGCCGNSGPYVQYCEGHSPDSLVEFLIEEVRRLTQELGTREV